MRSFVARLFRAEGDLGHEAREAQPLEELGEPQRVGPYRVTLERVAPAIGPTGGGNSVTITGTNIPDAAPPFGISVGFLMWSVLGSIPGGLDLGRSLARRVLA